METREERRRARIETLTSKVGDLAREAQVFQDAGRRIPHRLRDRLVNARRELRQLRGDQ